MRKLGSVEITDVYDWTYMAMEPIIEPIARELLEAELTPDRIWRKTNKGGNILYTLTAEECPNVMQEIGRLRELSFRDGGGGTGSRVDIDELDTVAGGYTQLIVWDPLEREIMGGYRYIIPRSSHPKYLSTEHYFDFSDTFRQKYLPYILELGRSFVQPKYQSRNNPKSLFALDNLWDGLGAIVVRNPDVKYCFGKVTMYGDYNRQARNLLLYFLKKHFPDRENLVHSRFPVEIDINKAEMKALFVGKDYAEDYKILSRRIRDFNETIPPLINAYMSLSPTMKVFDTALNPDFGNVEETAILITLSELYVQKVERHLSNIE